MDDASGGAPADRSWAVPVVWALAVVVGVGVVVGGALFVFSTGATCACSPPQPVADAGVEVDRNDSRVAVTYTADRGASNLLVHTEVPNGSVTVANTTGDATGTDEGIRLDDVGDAVTFASEDPTTSTTVEITVVARPPEGSDASPSVVLEETVTL